MNVVEDADRALVAALPMPVAQAWRRALYAESPAAIHERAMYALEAALKFMASTAIMSWAGRGAEGEAARVACGSLVRPSQGHWVAMLRACSGALADVDPAKRWLDRFGQTPLNSQLPALSGRTVVAVLDSLPAYRNSVSGHGAGLSSTDAQERAPLLLAVARSVLTAMTGDDAPQLFARVGTCVVRLVGPTAAIQPATAGYAGEPLAAASLVLQFADRGVPLAPLWVFDPEEDDVLVLNKGAGLDKVEYLSYGAPRGGSGLVVWKGAPAEQAKRLLGTVTGQGHLDGADVESLINETAVSELATQATELSFGPFRVVRKLAAGGQGILYEAIQVSPPRRVALKTLGLDRAFSDDARRRLREEAAALARVEHPHVVPIYETGETDAVPWIAMKFVEGKSLAEILAELRGRTSAVTLADWKAVVSTATGTGESPQETSPPSYFERIVTIGRDAARALAACHVQGVVHRDVKPGNLMIDGSGRVVLTDFGLARSVSARSQTFTRQLIGTLQYLAPETLLPAGRSGPDARVDVYGLGATLYEALALHRPFEQYEQDDTTLLHAVQTKDPAPLRRVAPRIPRELDTIVMKAVERDRDRRYSSAGELADDLDRYLRGEPIKARPAGLITRTRKWVRRHPARSASIVAALCLLAGVATWWRGESLRHVQAERQAAGVEQEMSYFDGALRTTLGLDRADSQSSRLDADTLRDAHALVVEAADHLSQALEDPLVQSTSAGARLAERRGAEDHVLRAVSGLATFYRESDNAWFLIGAEHDDEARTASQAAVDSLGALHAADWYDRLPVGDLKLLPRQLDQLRQDVHRQLILLGALRAKPAAVNLTQPAEPYIRSAREALQQADRFQRSAASDVVEMFCRMRLGEKEAIVVAKPVTATDHFLLGVSHFWIARFSESPVARMVLARAPRQGVLDFDQPMDAAIRHLRAACNLDPPQYWHHFTLAWALTSSSERTVIDALSSASPTPTPSTGGQGSMLGSFGALLGGKNQRGAAEQDAALLNFRDAELAMNACIALRPRYPRGYEMRGHAMVMQALRTRQSAAGQPVDSAQNQRADQTAAELEARGIDDLDRALQLAANDPIVYWARANTFGMLGRHQEALTAYARAMELDRPLGRLTGQTWVLAARSYLQRLTAGKSGQNDPLAWSVLAMANLVLSAQDDPAEASRCRTAAQAAASRALELDDKQFRARAVRGALELERGDAKSALADFEASLATGRKTFLAAAGRAHAFEALRQNDAALKAWADVNDKVAETDWQRQSAAEARQRIQAVAGGN